jgi:hypothetical protein
MASLLIPTLVIPIIVATLIMVATLYQVYL